MRKTFCNFKIKIDSKGPLLDVIQTDLGMSGVAASLITSLPVFCMGLFALFSIRLSNRFGIEMSLLIAMSLIFIATLYRGFITDSWSLIITALFSGIGIGLAGPPISGFIKKYFPEKLSVTSIYSVFMVIGASIATSFTVPLFNYFNKSWQIALSIWSILSLAAALLLLPLLITKKTEKVRTKTPSLKITNNRVFLFMMFFGCMAAIFYSITAWLAPFVQSMGMSHAQSGMILTLFTVIQIPVSFFIPFIVAKTGNRKTWLLLCSVAEFIGIVLLLGSFSPWIATIFLGFGAGGLFPLALVIPIEEANTSDEATSLSAQMQFGGFILGATGPLLFGLTLDIFNNYIPALVVILVLIIIMIVIIFKMESKPKITINHY
ncbi:CynX/NimT family MFS transporter [Peribacillus loiseleuriae]|uniref:MFS transporter n=1 Tax=Peribacillus loiseleuriae TaxID=1679170 RepID=A0A0K9H0C2_9BACI|nr:MFS transporter [Peribacillus loiseleuriae]KMY52295.1 MFS transporter [Peribacillus loiseleuriae]